ncbi:Prolyl 4-hydroxylase subunit alpha-3 [Saguinus oedipus]|uniref:Prolyl 4-hydroxylase subunit alpha-3 n=1 Tax=Saguinus oedipus TaxID=9490 RepID=A0ABQ9UV65_SAGOE|nr:Prolyl 4-hydroxylase subunit alpha-3 [Saguinus oedipus]
MVQLGPDNKRMARNVLKYERLLAESPNQVVAEAVIQRPNIPHLQTRDTYEGLCQTLGSQPTLYQIPSLYCSYETNSNPYLVLQPIQKEILHLEPYIALYHDFVSDSEAQKIREFAEPWPLRNLSSVPRGESLSCELRAESTTDQTGNSSPRDTLLGEGSVASIFLGLLLLSATEISCGIRGEAVTSGVPHQQKHDLPTMRQEGGIDSLALMASLEGQIQLAWLKDTVDPMLVTLNHRIAALTGLDVRPPYAEYLQVVNYGIGGHYEPHFDHATVMVKSMTNPLG